MACTATLAEGNAPAAAPAGPDERLQHRDRPAALSGLGPRLGMAVLRRALARLACGSLEVITPEGRVCTASGTAPGPHGVMRLHRWRALLRLLVAGTMGLAEGYMAGDWSSPDLAALLHAGALNLAALRLLGRPWPVRAWHRRQHRACANTRAGSRRNIRAHYDLGNDFYALWLDAGMNYSSALFTAPGMSLHAAQQEKQRAILRLLDLRQASQVLEIGIGWGGLAAAMAAAGADVTGITLSPAQLAHARSRLDRAGLAARLELCDYRDVAGSYDRIVSIEMIEAVGEEFWPDYFATLRARLRAGGVAVLQCITIADAHFPRYRTGADFIQRHIFPGGMLPCSAALEREAARAGLVITARQLFGPSYAETLRIWRAEFEAAWPAIAALGFSERFRRMWNYYLAYCAAGFRAGSLDVGLYRLEHAGP